MRYICLAILITGSAALAGCSNSDNINDFVKVNDDVATDQANANLAASRVDAVIGATKNGDTDEPQDISNIVLPEANLAEPVAVTGANASL